MQLVEPVPVAMVDADGDGQQVGPRLDVGRADVGRQLADLGRAVAVGVGGRGTQQARSRQQVEHPIGVGDAELAEQPAGGGVVGVDPLDVDDEGGEARSCRRHRARTGVGEQLLEAGDGREAQDEPGVELARVGPPAGQRSAIDGTPGPARR